MLVSFHYEDDKPSSSTPMIIKSPLKTCLDYCNIAVIYDQERDIVCKIYLNGVFFPRQKVCIYCCIIYWCE